jgi:hypothetical protein
MISTGPPPYTEAAQINSVDTRLRLTIAEDTF